MQKQGTASCTNTQSAPGDYAQICRLFIQSACKMGPATIKKQKNVTCKLIMNFAGNLKNSIA